MIDPDGSPLVPPRRDWIPRAGVYVGLTLWLARALLARLGSAFPHAGSDPVSATWILWWGSAHLPFTAAWWNAPAFHPAASAAALSDPLIGLLPFAATVQFLTRSPLLAYNIAFLLSFPLCGLAVSALAFELTGRRDAALLGGLAFVFAPYRMGQLAHIQVLSYYWAPMALLGLHRYLRLRARRWLVLFAVSWLMQGLTNASAFLPLSVLVVLWLLWFAPPVRAVIAIVAAWLCTALPVAPALFAYRAARASLHLSAGGGDMRRLGLDLADFSHASPDLAAWGGWLATPRADAAVFPGATLLILGAGGIATLWWRNRQTRVAKTRDQRVLLGAAMLAALAALGILAFGPPTVGPLVLRDPRGPLAVAVAARLTAWLRSGWFGPARAARSPIVFYAMAGVVVYGLALGPELRLLGRPLLYDAPYAWLTRLGGDLFGDPARAAMLGVLCQSLVLACGLASWSVRPPWRAMAVAAIAVGLLADGWVRLSVVAVPAAGPAWAPVVAAVVELPPGDSHPDPGALYRSMFHRRPIVNGYGDRYPPYYLPFVEAIRDRQYSVLHELTPSQPLGVAVDLSSSEAADLVAALGRMDAVDRGGLSDAWATFVVWPRSRPPVRVGPTVPIRAVSANRNSGNVARLTDANIDTIWDSGSGQTGDEEVIVDLGAAQSVGAIVFRMGESAFGFPRALEIDASSGGDRWTAVWGGPTAVQTVAAAVSSPATVPLTIDLGQVTARFLRVRQTGTAPGVPWKMADVEVRAPAAPVAAAAGR